MKHTDTILVSFNFTKTKEDGVLIVGRKEKDMPIEVLSAFKGEKALALYEQLVPENKRKINESEGKTDGQM